MVKELNYKSFVMMAILASVIFSSSLLLESSVLSTQKAYATNSSVDNNDTGVVNGWGQPGPRTPFGGLFTNLSPRDEIKIMTIDVGANCLGNNLMGALYTSSGNLLSSSNAILCTTGKMNVTLHTIVTVPANGKIWAMVMSSGGDAQFNSKNTGTNTGFLGVMNSAFTFPAIFGTFASNYPYSPHAILYFIPPGTTTATVKPNPSTAALLGTIKFYVGIADISSTESAPTGTVSWSDGGKGGSFNSTSCTLIPSSTVPASRCSISYTAPSTTGPVTITGTYSGDSIHKTSSGKSALTVTLRNTTATVTPNPSSAALLGTIKFHAAIADTSTGKQSAPTGTVSWSDGSAGGHFNSTSCTLKPFSKIPASRCSISYNAPSTTGPVTITGTYSGDGTHKTSSGTSAFTATLRNTTANIIPNPSSVNNGSKLSFHIAITDSDSGTKSAPTGTVSWSDGGKGGSFNSPSCTLIQYSTFPISRCSISYTAPSTTGPVTITGTYSGDGTHKTSSGTSALTVS